MTLYLARCRACPWRTPEGQLGQIAAAAMLHTEETATAGVFSPDLRRGHTVLVLWGDRPPYARRYTIRGFFRLPALKQAGPPTPEGARDRAVGPNRR